MHVPRHRRCPRGHFITGPNVVPSSELRGSPECQLCHRAQADAFNLARRKGVLLELPDAIRGQLRRTDKGRQAVALAALYNVHPPASAA